MTRIDTKDVGRIWIPHADDWTIGPAFPTGRRTRHAGVVTYVIRPGPENDTSIQRGWGMASFATEGLHQKFKETDDLQRFFEKPEQFVQAIESKLFRGYVPIELLKSTWHNERGVYGGRLLAKLGFAFVSAPTNATVVAPNYIAVNKTSTFTSGNFTFAKCGSSQSLSDGVANVGANVATNEFTANGLSRAIGTLSGYTDPTVLDGIFAGTIAKTFTDTTGASTFYGVAIVDASSTAAFNLFAESPQTSATLSINDTLAVTWTINS